MATSETEGKDLTTNQARAISALLVTKTVDEAAALAGVASRTVTRWASEDKLFRAALRRAENEVIDAAVRRLIRLQDKAAAVVEAVLDDAKASDTVRLRAAALAFDVMTVLRDTRNLEDRLTDLQERLEAAGL